MNRGPNSRCPYRGLIPFAEADAGFFFGRDGEIEVVVSNLLAARLTVLYGDSGAGKSSLLNAGVIPRLNQRSAQARKRPGRHQLAVVLIDRWQTNPLGIVKSRVCQCLTQLLHPSTSAPDEAQPLPGLLAAWADRVGGSLLLIFDQFEEYLRYSEGESGTDAFAEEFAQAVNRSDLRANFLLAVREDELARLDRFKGRVPALFRNLLRLECLDERSARAAIEEPLAVLREREPETSLPVAIEPELVKTVILQTRQGITPLNESGLAAAPNSGPIRVQAPYLQLVLTRLWETELGEHSRVLRLATFAKLGGVELIVRSHFDEVLGDFSLPEQAMLAGCLRYLVTPSGAKIAMSLADLALYSKAELPALGPVLERLCGSSRVLRPVAASREQPSVPRYEIYTESLARPALDWWRRFERAREKAEAEARLAEERHRRQVLMRFTVGVAVAFVIATMLGAVAWLKWREARVRELVTRANSELAEHPTLAARHALAAAAFLAHQSSQTAFDVENALRRALLADNERTWPAGPRPQFFGGPPWVSPDGQLEMDFTGDGSQSVLAVFQRASGQRAKNLPLRYLTNFAGLVRGVDFSGTLVATGTTHGEVQIWSRNDFRWLKTVQHPDTNVLAVALSSDGSLLAAASSIGTVCVWRWETNTPPLAMRHSSRVNQLAFSPDGFFLVSAGDDGVARVWAMPEGGKMIAELRRHTNAVFRATFSADGESVWTRGVATDDLRFWSARAGQLLPHNLLPIRPESWWKPGLFGLAPAAGSNVLIRLDEGSERRLAHLSGAVERFCLNRDASCLAYQVSQTEVRVRESNAPPEDDRVLTHSNKVVAIGFSPAQDVLATLQNDGIVCLWKWREQMFAAFKGGSSNVEGHLAFSPDGAWLGVASGNVPKLFSWLEVSSGQSTTPKFTTNLLGHDHTVNHCCFSADGSVVVTTDLDKRVMVWELPSGRLINGLGSAAAHTKRIVQCDVSPLGPFVATASSDGTAQLWDWRDPSRSLAVLAGHNGALTGVRWSPDGRAICTFGADGTVRRHAAEELVPLRDLIKLAHSRERPR